MITDRERAVLTIAAEHGPTWPLTPREMQNQLRQPRWQLHFTIGVVRSLLARLAREGLLARHVVGSKMIDYTITELGRRAVEDTEDIEDARREALHIMENMTATMLIIGHRLGRIGPGRDVPPEAADADGLVRSAAELREALGRIEAKEIAAGLVEDHAYVRQEARA